jgi:lipoate-protein ligase A
MIRQFRGSATEFHGRTIGDDPALEIWVFEVEQPALVLGSTQRPEIVDAEACGRAGVEVVRRRSGGGLVLLEPGNVVWFDIVVPAAQLHAVGVGDDIRASMIWLGDAVAAALGALDVAGVAVHREGLTACSAWCPLVCFAGIGAGEIVVNGRKLVGISQRRTRAGARFQCAVHSRWSPQALTALLAGDLPSGDPGPIATLPPDTAAALPGALAAALEAAPPMR